LAALPDDPNRDASVSRLIWEIRRERQMELFGEPSRLMDLKRWKKINYMRGSENPDIFLGLWVDFSTTPEVADFLTVGTHRVQKENGEIITYNGTNKANMTGFYMPINVEDREVFTDRVYLAPMGKNQMDLYESRGFKLTQTEGW
jgi:hypothetical protein